MDTEVQEDQIHMVCQAGKDLVAVEVLEEQAVQVQNIGLMMNMVEMVEQEDQVR
jgi:hypothetical protein